MDDFSKVAEHLQARLTELTGRVGVIEDDLRHPLDADWAEQAVDLADDEALEGVDEVLRAEARAIGLALARMEAGSYGTCTNCGAEIPRARLEAQPMATTCLACAADGGSGAA